MDVVLGGRDADEKRNRGTNVRNTGTSGMAERESEAAEPYKDLAATLAPCGHDTGAMAPLVVGAVAHPDCVADCSSR
jgi:hypothetical protein